MIDPKQLQAALEKSFTELGETLRGDVVRAGQALRGLLTEKIRFTPTRLARGKATYRLSASLKVGSIVVESACRKVYVPDGI